MRSPRWSASDVSVLRQLAGRVPAGEIAARLGRTVGSVYCQASRLAVSLMNVYFVRPVWNKGLKRDPRQCIPRPALRGRAPWNKGMKFGPRPDARGRDPEKARQRSLRYARSEKGKLQARRTRFSGNWQAAIDRAGGLCELCGVKAIRIHHKDGRGGNSPKAERNDELDNLIALCESCHRRIHRAIERGADPYIALGRVRRRPRTPKRS